MRQPEVLKYLLDIKMSIEAIERYTSDLKSQDEYAKDEETIDSVERRLAIIGEALFKANKADSNLSISNKTKIIGLRHILIHEYDLIAHAVIWDIIQIHLPILKKEIELLLD